MFRYLHGDFRRQMLFPLRSRPSKGKLKLPEGVRIYAMTDIHGCAHLLEQMLRVIDADLARSRPRYALEVYKPRPDSRATLDILINRSRRGNTVFLKEITRCFLAMSCATHRFCPSGCTLAHC